MWTPRPGTTPVSEDPPQFSHRERGLEAALAAVPADWRVYLLMSPQGATATLPSPEYRIEPPVMDGARELGQRLEAEADTAAEAVRLAWAGRRAAG